MLQCMTLIGSAAYVEGHWLNSLYNDALGHVLLNETNDALRIVISLIGLQFSGVSIIFMFWNNLIFTHLII